MSTLSDADKEALAEPMYDAYRLGRYATSEYLPMWHELDDKPTGTPEHEALFAVVEAIARRAWDEGYARGVRDECGDLERADNPYVQSSPDGLLDGEVGRS